MKKLLLSALLVTFGLALFAQSFTLFYEGDPIPPNGSIQIICDPGDEVVTGYVACKNDNALALSVKTKKIIYAGDTLPGTSNYFCWGACFPPFVYISPTALMIEPGATNNDFYADYEPHLVPGISRITYVFFDENNPDDSAAVTVDWNASPAGLGNELLSLVSFSEAYPNPASSIARIDYSLPSGLENSSIVITNLLGAKIDEIPLNDMDGQAEIPVYDLQDGVYFYTLKSQQNLAITKKLVVRH